MKKSDIFAMLDQMIASDINSMTANHACLSVNEYHPMDTVDALNARWNEHGGKVVNEGKSTWTTPETFYAGDNVISLLFDNQYPTWSLRINFTLELDMYDATDDIAYEDEDYVRCDVESVAIEYSIWHIDASARRHFDKWLTNKFAFIKLSA